MEERSHYAPAERSTLGTLSIESELINSQKLFLEVFKSLTGIGAVVDKNRQIVFANDEFLSWLGINSLESVFGKRPGEVISCLNSGEDFTGCGTSRQCAYCGAVNAIIESQQTGIKSMKETHITGLVDGKLRSWDLNVISVPMSFSNELFYILILQDISAEKRRAALERIFFHDLLNSIGGLNGLLNILKEETNFEETRKLINLSEESSRNIIEEILLQRQISEAERGELKIKVELTGSLELLNLAIAKIMFHEAVKGRNIIIADNPVDIDFETDKILLQRVIINVLKNALESTPENGTVTTGIMADRDKIIFWVKNDQVIPENVQMQLFLRSFSTKGDGRGIGTYSIRLLAENYLAGKVSFVSNEEEKTVFSIELNKRFPQNNTGQ
jgi:nitrogen-specific signal transduction histidine kinase